MLGMTVQGSAGSGEGDMLKSTYDANSDDKIDNDKIDGDYIITEKTDDYSIQATDFGFNKMFHMNAGTAKTFTLPSVAAGDIGKTINFAKTGAGKVTITTSDSDTIGGSSAGGTVYNDEAGETYATMSLVLVTATDWYISSYLGTWVTT